MSMLMCVKTERWPGLAVRLIVVIIIAAATVRWAPDVAAPVIAGLVLSAWLLAGVPALARV